MLFEKDGFVIDLNKLSRRDYLNLRKQRVEAQDDERDLIDAEFLTAKVVVKWPFDKPVSLDGYLDLGFADSLLVDQMVSEAIDLLAQKKSSEQSI